MFVFKLSFVPRFFQYCYNTSLLVTFEVATSWSVALFPHIRRKPAFLPAATLTYELLGQVRTQPGRPDGTVWFFCLAPALLHSSSSSLDNLDRQRSHAPRREVIFIFCQLSLLAQTLNITCVLSPQSVWEFLKFAHWVFKPLFGCILLLNGSFFFFFFWTVNGFAVESDFPPEKGIKHGSAPQPNWVGCRLWMSKSNTAGELIGQK